MSVKFVKNGKKVAVLKDEAHEPEGFAYIQDNIMAEDIVIAPDAQSLEEMDKDE